MDRRALLNRSIAAAAAASFVGTAYASGDVFNLIDFVVMNDAVSIEARNQYEAALKPIAARHGARVVHSYDLQAHLAGPMPEAVRINVWAFADPKALAHVSADPEYAALVPMRDSVHNMKALTLYMAQPIRDTGPIEEGVILVDLVSMADGAGDAERDAYEAKMAPLAAGQGFEVHSAFRTLEKIGGTGPLSPLRLNLWSGQDPEGLARLNADPDYQALAPERDAITDFSQLALFMAKPRET
jgi:uncharacterized protein (DUF1330 family)